jgi:molybdopterin synthase catalytic subunit
MAFPLVIRVSPADFEPGALMNALALQAGENTGAVASFVGHVREKTGADGRIITAMWLEHYPGMTEKSLDRLATEAASRWPLGAIHIIHRTGRLCVGERIVFVGVASAHRHAAFEACAFIMDQLKTRAPFWKSEEDATGQKAWVCAKAQDEAAAARWQAFAVPGEPA